MSRAGRASWPRPVAVVVAVVTAFVVGLVGTAMVALQLAGGRTDTANLVFAGVAGVGALCAVIGAMTRFRPEALVAGSVGLVVAVVILGSGYTAFWVVLLCAWLAVPYLAGFGGATLLGKAFVIGLRRGPGPASLVAAVIIVVLAAGAVFVGPRLIGGPCMGTSVERSATSYLALADWWTNTLVSLDSEFNAAGQDAAQLKAAYSLDAVYDDDFNRFVKGVCFAETVRSQVDALTAAVDARARVHRLLAGDPFNTDPLAQLSSSQKTVTVAMAELRRVLGLPPLSEPSTPPGS